MSAIKRFAKSFFIAAIVVGFLAFSIDNRHAITVSFFPLPYSAEMPEFLFAILCFILGALTGGVVASLGSWQAAHQRKAAERRIMALENEIAALREQPQENLPAAAAKME